ncbi:putative dimethylaniline monooxygenase [Halenospora varia]|nr:putative dimethylaniline monooxygenase [Halenospora varia]
MGAGVSALCLAYKMRIALSSYSLSVYEKTHDIGGIWLENRYPRCACDIPAHVYSKFLTPEFTQYYTGAEEIHKYISGKILVIFFIPQHGSCLIDYSRGYNVEIKNLTNGTVFVDYCYVLINATGFLNKWKWPAIPGLESFKGPKLHSAAWDQKVDCKGKRVAVIGTGSSAIQIVP